MVDERKRGNIAVENDILYNVEMCSCVIGQLHFDPWYILSTGNTSQGWDLDLEGLGDARPIALVSPRPSAPR